MSSVALAAILLRMEELSLAYVRYFEPLGRNYHAAPPIPLVEPVPPCYDKRLDSEKRALLVEP